MAEISLPCGMASPEQAEQALCEANILDPHNAQVWGMLCVVCLEFNKDDEAEMASKQALKLGLNTQVCPWLVSKCRYPWAPSPMQDPPPSL